VVFQEIVLVYRAAWHLFDPIALNHPAVKILKAAVILCNGEL